MNILSIQSHVCYGYVGNKAAVFPLQSMGFDVWPIHTVQFSNHTGYGHWSGTVFSAAHIAEVIEGLKKLGVLQDCHAILSGYLGDSSIGEVILTTFEYLRKIKSNVIYLCDPVMGDSQTGCFVRPGITDFFKKNAVGAATLLTPNHFEAEILWGSPIRSLQDAVSACHSFLKKETQMVAIKSLRTQEKPERICSLFVTKKGAWLGHTPHLEFKYPLSGTGDLFSALLLGYFLKTQDAHETLSLTLQNMLAVLQVTQASGLRELQVVGRSYEDAPQGDVKIEKLQ